MRLCAQVEAAYDILLMQSMKRRMSGDVGSAVRFADVKRARPASKVCCVSQQRSVLALNSKHDNLKTCQ